MSDTELDVSSIDDSIRDHGSDLLSILDTGEDTGEEEEEEDSIINDQDNIDDSPDSDAVEDEIVDPGAERDRLPAAQRSSIAISIPSSRPHSNEEGDGRPSSVVSSRRSSVTPSEELEGRGPPRHGRQTLLHPDAARGSTRRPSSSTASPTPSETSDSSFVDEDNEGVDNATGAKGAKSVTFRVTGAARKSPEVGRATKKQRGKKTAKTGKKPAIVVSRAGPSQAGEQVSDTKTSSIKKGRRRHSHLSKSPGSSRSVSPGSTTGEDENKDRDEKKKKKRNKKKTKSGSSGSDTETRRSKKKRKMKKLYFHEGDESKIIKILEQKKDRLKDINVESVHQFSKRDEKHAQDYAPPADLSPRSAAEYVRKELIRAAQKRKAILKAAKKKKKRQKSSKSDDEGSGKDGKSRKKRKKAKAEGSRKTRKGRRKRRRKKRKKFLEEEDESDIDSEEARRRQIQAHKPTARHDDQFYPISQFKRRRYIVPDAKPVVCTICDGIHFRTKRNFAANLKIIISVNKALTAILNEMRHKMKKIDTNLVKVKKNLEYLEDMYEGVFQKVNRLIVD